MISWIMIGLSTSNADVFVDSQVVGQQQGSFVLDDLNTENDTVQWLYTRSLLGYNGNYKTFRYALNLELLNSQVEGTESELGLDVSPTIFRNPKQNMAGTWILPRDAYVATQFGDWGVQLGIQSFDWGLGILSNSGTQATRFGVNQQGNIYTRLAVSRAFDTLHWFVATDAIVRDENALWSAGDRAYQAITGLQYIQDGLRVGALSGFRYQQDRESYATPFGPTSSWAIPVDTFATVQLSDSLQLASEMVGVWGRTTRLVNEATQGGEASIQYFGGVGRLQHQRPTSSGKVETLLETGWASGDGNNGDATARTFSLHSDYNVGLILYDEVLPSLQARSVERLADESLSAQPAPGLQYAVPQGGVNNSVYLQLCSSLTHKNWLVRAAWMEAFSAVPYADPYQTALHGGYSTGLNGEASDSIYLGAEADVRLQYALKELVYMGVDAGYFMPGSALDILEPTTKVLGYIQVKTGGQQ